MKRVFGEIIKELLDIKGGIFAIGNDQTVGEMTISADVKLTEEKGVIHIFSKAWKIHLDLTAIHEAMFIKQKEPSGTIPYLLYLSFRNKKDFSIISFFFPNPWLDINGNVTEYNAEKYKIFELIMNRYIRKKSFTFIQKD